MPEYSINDCSLYGKSIVDLSTPVYVFEKNNHALPVWGTISCKIGKRLKLVTFDTHNDTRAPFTQIISENMGNHDDGINDPTVASLLRDKRYSPKSFSFEDVFVISNMIKNDEQIKTAFDFGYIDSYYVVHREPAEGFEDYDRCHNYKCKYYDSDDINWDELYCIESPIALDFDLDYFIHREDLGLEFKDKVKNLIMRAR